MEVEFERLGPGQVGRWAYQVIGSNGPVPNPRGIRYMNAPPDVADVGSSTLTGPGLPGAHALASYAEFANLGLGVANLAVSAAVLQQVRAMRRKLQQVQLGIESIDAKMDHLLEKATRIDINVAQIHLREVLRMRMQEAWSSGDGFLDLAVLAEIRPDLLRFLDSVDDYCVGGAVGLQLSSDIRAMLHALLSSFIAANSTAAAAFNLSIGGDPERVLDGVDDGYGETWQRAALVLSLQNWFERTATAVGEHMHIAFRFGDRNREKAVVLQHEAGLSNTLQTWDPEAVVLAQQVRRHVGGDTTGDLTQAQRAVKQYWEAWLLSDAGLLTRVVHQLEHWADSDHWSSMDGWARELPGGHVGVVAPGTTAQELSSMLRSRTATA